MDHLKISGWKCYQTPPSSSIYQMWSKKLPETWGAAYMASAVVLAFNDWKVGIPAVASGVLATVMKASAHEFCDWAKPEPFMSERKEMDAM